MWSSTFSCIFGDHGEGSRPVDHPVAQARAIRRHHSTVHGIHKELQRTSCGGGWGKTTYLQKLCLRKSRPRTDGWLCRWSTWDVVPLVFNVHLVQAPLSGLVLDGDGAVLVVSDVRPSRFSRGHPHLTCQMTVWVWDQTITKANHAREKDAFLEGRRTCDFTLLRCEGHQEVDWAEERVHRVTGGNWLVGGLSITGREVFRFCTL